MAIKNKELYVDFKLTESSSSKLYNGLPEEISLYHCGDGGALTLLSGIEIVDANLTPGIFRVLLTAEQMNYDRVTVAGKYSDSNYVVHPVFIETELDYALEVWDNHTIDGQTPAKIMTDINSFVKGDSTFNKVTGKAVMKNNSGEDQVEFTIVDTGSETLRSSS